MLRSAAVAIVALALGVLTAYAQGWLPQQMGSLANSAGSWALVAFALSLMATSGWLAAVFGSASLLALLAGYVLGAEMQGYPLAAGSRRPRIADQTSCTRRVGASQTAAARAT